MALNWIRISLRGFGRETPTGRAFFDLLKLPAESDLVLRPSDSPWQAASIILLEVDIEDLKEFHEPSEEFAARLHQGLLKIAERLASFSSGTFEQWRTDGRQ